MHCGGGHRAAGCSGLLAPRRYRHASLCPPRRRGQSIHIQQLGKGHPTPSLLDNEDQTRSPELRAIQLAVPGLDAARATAQLEAQAGAVLQVFVKRACLANKDPPHGGWLYNVFGFDVVFDGQSADAVLLEVNVFPAIAGGTMGAVPRDVYARLVDDTLRLLGPILDCSATSSVSHKPL
jgi:hypothetical protein